MTDRELFNGFYSIARLNTGAGGPFQEALRTWLTTRAALLGVSNYRIMKARNAALCAKLARMQPHREPSRNSVAIQLSVHTFGRVTRGRA